MQTLMGAGASSTNGMLLFDEIMSQLKLGGVPKKVTQSAMKGDITAADATDSAGGHFVLARQLNVQPGGKGAGGAEQGAGSDFAHQAAIGAAGLINPGRTDVETAAVAVGINQPFRAMRLKSMGIDMGTGPGSSQDPLTLAKQILDRVDPTRKINTPEKITFHLDDPHGALNVTLQNWEAQGLLPPGSVPVIKDEMRAILLARIKNMDFGKLQTLFATARGDDQKAATKAVDELKKAGVIDDSAAQAIKKQKSEFRDTKLNLTDEYASAIDKVTGLLGKLADQLEQLTGSSGSTSGISKVIQQIPVLGTWVNWAVNAVAGGGGSGSDIGSMGGLTADAGTGGNTPSEKQGTSHNPVSGLPNVKPGSVPKPSLLPNAQPGTGRDAFQNGGNVSSVAAGSASGAGKASGVNKAIVKFIKPVNGKITSGFGTRIDPKTHSSRMHSGVDFGVRSGTPIHAAAAGKVTFSGTGGGNAWAGNYVMIDHGGGVETLYAHQSRTSAKSGATMQQGQVIGYSGSTGRSTGPHLHFEIHINGRAVDPAPYLGGAGVAVDPTTPPSAATDMTGTDTGTASSNATATASLPAPGGLFSGWTNPSIEEVDALGSSVGAAGPGGSSTLASDTGTPGGTPASTPTADTGTAAKAPTSVSGNKAIVMKKAAAKGWTGAQWNALYQLVMHESSFNNTAQNRNSTARGLFQFLDTTWETVGGTKTDDPNLQTDYGLQYIKQRYGDPIKAWAHWQRKGSYAQGAWELDRDQAANVHKGEMIIPAEPAKQIRDAITNGSPAASKARAGGGVAITIEKGAIVVQTSGGVTSAGVADLGQAVATALAENDKIKRLQMGVLT